MALAAILLPPLPVRAADHPGPDSFDHYPVVPRAAHPGGGALGRMEGVRSPQAAEGDPDEGDYLGRRAGISVRLFSLLASLLGRSLPSSLPSSLPTRPFPGPSGVPRPLPPPAPLPPLHPGPAAATAPAPGRPARPPPPRRAAHARARRRRARHSSAPCGAAAGTAALALPRPGPGAVPEGRAGSRGAKRGCSSLPGGRPEASLGPHSWNHGVLPPGAVAPPRPTLR